MSTFVQSCTCTGHLSSNPRPTTCAHQSEIPSMSKVGSYSFMTSDGRLNRESAPFGSSFEAGSPFLLSSSSTSPTISSDSTSQPNVNSGVSKSRRESSHSDQLRGRNRNRNRNGNQEDDEKEILFDNQPRSHSTSTSSPHLTQTEDGNHQNNLALEPAWDDASVIDSTSVGRRGGGSTISDHGDPLPINDDLAQDGITSELYSHLSLQNSQDSIDGLMDHSSGDAIGGVEKDKVISRTSSINNLPYLKDSVFDSRNGWNPNRRQREREEGRGLGSGLGKKEDGKVVQSLNKVRTSAPPVLPQRSASRRGKERGDPIGAGIDDREMKEQGEEGMEMEMEMEAKSGRENQDESKSSSSLPISTSSSSTNDQPQWNQSDSQSSSNEPSLLKSGETMSLNGVSTPTSSTYNNTSDSSIVSQKEKERKEAFEVEALRRQVEQLQMALLKRSDSNKESEKVSSNHHHLDVSTPTQEAPITLLPVSNNNNSQQERRTSLSLPTERHLALEGGGSIGNGSGSGSRNSTPTRIHVPERSLSSIALDHPNSTPTHLSQEERWLHQEREIMSLKRQQQMLYSQQVMAANGNGNPTLSYNHQSLNGWPNSHHLDHLHSPGSSLPAIDEYRSQTPSLPILISNPQHYQQHQQHESNGENVQRFYSPIQTNQMNHIHQHSPSQLQFQQQQLYNQQGHYPNNQSHGSFSPSSGSYVGSSAFRKGSGSGISSSATSLWQEEDGNHSMSNFPPSASVADSRNDYQLEEMQKKIEALERLVRMQAGLPSLSNSPSRIGSPSGPSSGLPSGPSSGLPPSNSISSTTLSLRDQLPGPAPSSPLPLPPPIQSQRAHDRIVATERIDAGVNHGPNDSQASLQSFHPLINGRSNVGNLTQSRSSGSTSSEDSVHWINHQQQLAQLQHQIDLSNRRGNGTGIGNQSSLIEKNPQDEVAYDMRKRSQSTLSSLQTTFNFNATSPIDDTSNHNHGLGSGFQDPNLIQAQLPLSSSPLQSQFASSNSKSKSKSSKFLPSLGRRKSTSHEESLSSSSKDHSLLSTSPPSQLNRTNSHNGGAAPLASVGEKEIWNGFSRKHSKVVVKTDEPVAKFKQGPGRGRVYINPPEKRKKNKD